MSSPCPKDPLNNSLARSMTHVHCQTANIVQDPSFTITTAMLWVRSPRDDVASGCGPSSSCLKQQNLTEPATYIHHDGVNHQQDAALHLNANTGDRKILRIHQDRLIAAAEALGWHHLQPLQLNDGSPFLLLESIHQHLAILSSAPEGHVESRKLRVFINKLGMVTVDSSAINCAPESKYFPLCVPEILCLPPQIVDADNYPRPCRVYVDIEATPPSIFTTHKTKQRDSYNRARKRVNIEHSLPTEEEVLLYNPHGEIIETSNCTVYFLRDDQWITPAAICGPNVGVTRRIALERKLCKQGTIELKDIQDGEMIWLSNAVRGFFIGTVDVTFHVRSRKTANSNVGRENVETATQAIPG